MSLTHRGVNYDTGTNYLAGGALSRSVWHHDLVDAEIRAIRHQLNCNAVAVFGTRIDRINHAAQIALEHGLEVWLQPRLVDGGRQETLEHVAQAAEAAEALRVGYSRVVLNVGCELSIFSSGIVPGASHLKRAARLASPRFWPMIPRYNRRLNTALSEVVEVARSRFNGQLTYSAGLWERVDWARFDIVGLDYYRMRHNRARYRTNLRKFHRHGKPVVITEFGTGSYQGAENKGPASHDIIDTSGPTPRLIGAYVRDEHVQANQLNELLDIYEAEDVSGTFVFEFIEPYNPHTADARHDLDMAGYGIVKVLPGNPQQPYRWEPKAAFHTIATRYALSTHQERPQ